jgi:SAM-dependent methyltransferase
MNDPATLFRNLMRTSPFQPATNLWRAVELDAVQRHGLPPGRGLDLGCGDGKLTCIVDDATRGAGARRWVGVDIDPLETSQAMACGRYDRVHTASAAAIPEPDASMDFVFSNSVLEHIGSIEDVLAEAARLLRPGGRFIATVPGPGFHRALRGPLVGGKDRDSYLRDIDTRCAHLRYWGTEEWRARLGQHGLVLQVATDYLTPKQTRRWELISNLTGGLLYALYGRRARPIEIQRRLGLRRTRPGLTGAIGRALAPWLAAGCRLDAPVDPSSRARLGDGACLLIDATKQ